MCSFRQHEKQREEKVMAVFTLLSAVLPLRPGRRAPAVQEGVISRRAFSD